MIARPFGFLGSKYKLNSRTEKLYLSAWIVAAVSIGLIVAAGVLEIRHPGSVSWGWIALSVFILLAVTVRLLILVMENSEMVRGSHKASSAMLKNDR